MIRIKLMGGLGNQMFQYAVGLSLSEKKKIPLVLDKFYLDNRDNLSKNSVIRNYDLDIFKLNDDVLLCTGKRNFFKRNFHKLIPKSYRSYYIEPHFNFDPSIFNLRSSNIILEGYWQSHKYFKEIDQLLKEKFEFKHQVIDLSQLLYEEINSTESICLNVRRGDFLTDNNLGFKDIDYFRKAIALMEEKLNSNSKYFIFSDDIEWCRNNFQFLKNKVIVDHTHKGYKFSNYLQLMIKCKHFIIPNSSFGWWAAYLSNYHSKIVVAPKTWFIDASLDTSDLIPNDWYRI